MNWISAKNLENKPENGEEILIQHLVYGSLRPKFSVVTYSSNTVHTYVIDGPNPRPIGGVIAWTRITPYEEEK